MQSVYALLTSKNDRLDAEVNFLKGSIDKMSHLYVLLLDVLLSLKTLAVERIEISKKKHLASEEDLNPNTKFIEHPIFYWLETSSSFQNYKETNQLNHWHLEEKYIRLIFEDLQKSTLYQAYLSDTDASLKKQIKFMVALYSEFIAPNEKLSEYFEDVNISWVDDIPFVNTWVVKTLEGFKPGKPFVLTSIYKDEEDRSFAIELFQKVVLNHVAYEKEIENKTPNWESDRIADLDMILIKMGICEFLSFPFIPTKATINEYIELAKDYSSEKSSYFINGVLDKVCRDLTKSNRLQKTGRGTL
jgi:N utilization substance protein B